MRWREQESEPESRNAPVRGRSDRLRRLVGVLLLLAAVSAPAPSEDASPLADRHARWLDETGVLLTERERVEFLALGESYRRDAFVESFWISRDPHPETARNELRDTWEERLAAAREQFGTVRDVDHRSLRSWRSRR